MLITRVLTGAVLAALVTGVMLGLPTLAVAVAFGALWLGGAAEWRKLAQLGGVWPLAYPLLHLVAMMGLWAIGVRTGFADAVLWLVLVALGFAIGGMARFPGGYSPAVVAIIGLASLVPSWLAIAQLHAESAGLGLAAITMIWGADVGAFAVGRTLGRHKLAPRISPGKTWEGVGGGLLAAIAVAGAAVYLLDLSPLLLAVAAVAAAASVLGDLAVSMLKRRAGLKDSGRLLPGHGGVLDRIDGLTTGLPILAVALQFCRLLD